MRKRYTVFFLVLILTIVCKTGQTIAQNKENPPPLMNLPTCGHGHDQPVHHEAERDQIGDTFPNVTPSITDYSYFNYGIQVIPDMGDFDSQTTSQTTCTNSNFSLGNFSNWSGCSGLWCDPPPSNWTRCNGSYTPYNPPCNNPNQPWFNTPAGGRFAIQTPGPDPCIQDLQKVFPGDAYSALIGNRVCGSGGGGYVDRIAYPITYDPNNSFLIYRSAVVLDSPLDETHDSGDKRPRFIIVILDHNTGDTLDDICGKFDLFPGDGVTQWNGDPEERVWKDWSTVGIDLSQLTGITAGQLLDVVFQVHGCSFTAHTGYAYVSLVCQQMNVGMSGCEGTNVVQLSGPPGFASYLWKGPYCATCTPTTQTGNTITVNNALSGWRYSLTLTSFYNNCKVVDIWTTLQFTRIVPDFEPLVGCVGGLSTFIDHSEINQNPTNERIWNFGDGTATVTVSTASVTHTYTAPGNYVVSLTRTSTDPCSATKTMTISVTDVPPEFSAPVTPAKSICTGEMVAIPLTVTPTTATAYWNTTVISGTVSITTSPPNPAVTSSINDVIENLGTTPAVVSYSIYPGSIYCHGASATVTVTIHPRPIPAITGISSSCVGTSGVSYSTEAGKSNYLWAIAPPGTGTVTSGTGTNTVDVTWLSPGTHSLTVTYTDANGCSPAVPSTKTVTVNPLPVPVINGPPTVCKGTTNANYTTQTGKSGYLWTISSGGIITGGQGTNSINVTWTNEENQFIGVNFTEPSTGCTAAGTTTKTVIVNPIPDVNTVTSQVVCNGSTTDAITFSGTFTETVYSWNNSQPSINLLPNGTGNISSFNATNLLISPVTATITVTPSYTYAGETCTGQPTVFTITVNPTAHVTQPTDVTVCNGGTVSATIFTSDNTGGTTTYTWSNSDPTIGLTATGTANIPEFTAINTGTSPVVATITVTPTFTNEGTSCQGPSKSFTITINPTAQVNDVNSQVVCNGLNTSPITFSTSNTGGNTTYSWANDTPSIGLDATGTGNISSFAAINNGTSPVVATIIVTPHFENNSVNCDGPATSFTITVNPTGQVNQPDNITVCNGVTVFETIFTTNNTDGSTTYTWTNSDPTIGLTATGTANIPEFTASNTGTLPVVANISVTPTFTNEGTSCQGPSKTFTITVNPTGQVNQPASQVVCNTATATVVFTTNNTLGNTTYAWVNDNPGIGLGSSGNGNISFVSTNPGTFPISGTIGVIPTFVYGGTSCTGAIKSFTITVNPTGQVEQPNSQVVCNGASTAAIGFTTTNTVGTTTYTWTNSDPTIGLSATSGTGTITSFIASNTGTSPKVAIIEVTPTFENGGTYCAGISKAFTITANPAGQVNQPDNVTVCNGATVSATVFATINTGGITTYNWTNTDPTIGLTASGTTTISAFTAINTGTSPVVATITVIPAFTNGGTPCQGPSKSFTITVNPTPGVVFDPASTPTICTGSTASIIFVPTVTGNTTTFNWTVPSLPSGVSMVNTSGTGSVSEIINNTTNIPQTVVFHVMPVAATCSPAAAFTYSVVVNPKPTVIFPASPANPQQVCSGAVSTPVPLSSSVTVPGVTYAWTAAAFDPVNPTSAIGGFTTPNSGSTIPGENIVSSLLTQGVIKYTVTPTFTSAGVVCPGDPQLYQTLVNPSPTVALNPSDPTGQAICSGGTSQIITFTPNTPPTETTYQWEAFEIVNVTGATMSGTTNFIPAQTLTLSGTTQGRVKYKVTPVYNGSGTFTCPGGVSYSTIFVNPNPTPSITGLNVVCENQAGVSYYTPDIPGHSYQWIVTGASSVTNANTHEVTVNWGPASGSPGTLVLTETINASGCFLTTPAYSVTINPRPDVTFNYITPSQCSGQPLNIQLSSNVPGTTFSWTTTASSPNILPNTASGNTSTINNTFTNNGFTIETVTFTVMPAASNCSPLTPYVSVPVPIYPIPDLIATPSTLTICSGATANITLSSGVANTTFAWTSSANPANVVPSTANGTGSIAQSYLNNGIIIEPVTFSIIPTANNCSAPAGTYTLYVNPKPTVIFPASPANPQQVCSGAISTPVPLSSSVTIPGVTYAWTAAAFDPVNPTMAITGFTTPNSGNTIPGENIVSSLLTQGVIKYQVTPTFTNAGVACSGDALQYQTLVNPSPTVALNPSDPTGQSICSGGTSQIITFTPNTPPAETSYLWEAVEVVNVTGAIMSNNTGFIPAQTLTLTGLTQGHVKYKVTPIYNGSGTFTCPGGVSFSTIFVNPNPTPTITGKSLACELGPNETYSTPAIANHSYSWTVTGGTITSDPTQNQITVTWGPYTVSPGTLVVTETIDATGCVTTTPPYQVVLQQRPIPSLAGPVSVCDGSTGKVYQTETGMANYEWDIQGGTISSGGGTSNPSATVTWNTVGVQWIQVKLHQHAWLPRISCQKT